MQVLLINTKFYINKSNPTVFFYVHDKSVFFGIVCKNNVGSFRNSTIFDNAVLSN